RGRLFRSCQICRKVVFYYEPVRPSPGKIRSLPLSQEGIAMLDRQTIRQTLVELIEADLDKKFDNLDEGQKLREDLGLDSVDVVSIVSQIERRFRIRFSQQELDPQVLVTVRDVLNLMEVKLAELPASQSSAA